jgi:hypothetical protein
MIPYIICFTISVGASYFATVKKCRIGRIKLNSVFFLLSVFLPCFLASVRGPEIGKDVSVYGDKLFMLAKQYNDFFAFYEKSQVEILFSLIAFISSKLFNIQIYYFLIQLFTILPIVFLLKRNEYKKYMWLGISLYLLWMYPFTLNIMRQSIAISIVLYGYTFIKERNLKKYIICCMIAMGFHRTAILGFLIYLINVLISTDPKSDKGFIRKILRKYKQINVLVISLMSLLSVFLCSQIVTYLSTFNQRYEAQLLFSSSFGVEYINILFISVFLFILFYLYQRTNNTELFFMTFIIAIGAVIYQIKASYSQMYRLSMYYVNYFIIAFPYGLTLFRTKKNYIFSLIVILISIASFWYYIIHSGWHSVYPFMFR